MRRRGLVRFVTAAQVMAFAIVLVGPASVAAATLGYTLGSPSVSTVQYSDLVTFQGTYTCLDDATTSCPTTASTQTATFSLRRSGGSTFTNVASVSTSVVFTSAPGGCSTLCSVPFQVVWRAGRAGAVTVPPGVYDLRLVTTIGAGELVSSSAITITTEDTETISTGATAGIGGTAFAVKASVVDLDRGASPGTGIITPDVNLGGTAMVSFALYDATNTTLIAGPISATLLSSGVTITGPTLTPPMAGGSFRLRTTYAGNAFYLASTDLDVVTVAPANTPPSLVLPAGTVVAEATSPAGAAVSYVVSATDPEDDPDPTASCNPASGSTFGLGDTTVSCTVTDANGATTPGSFTVRVRDTTVPHVAVTTAESAGGTGWYNAASNDGVAGLTIDVSDSDLVGVVSLSCTDNGVDVGALAPGGDSFVVGDGSHLVSCTASDGAANSATAGASFDVDQAAPSVSGALSPSPSGTGWWNASTGAPTATWTCTDPTSGLVSCSHPSAVGEGTNQSVSATATDAAGNIGTGTVAGVNVDLTAPSSITLTGTTLVDGGAYDFGSAPGAPSGCTAVEAGSGLASCVVSGYGSAVGSWTVTATATDNAGNVSATTFSYSVAPWFLTGFDNPIDMTAPNDLKAGNAVNLKFSIDAGVTDLSTLVVIAGIDQELVACPAAKHGPNGHGGGNQALAARKVGTAVSTRWQSPAQPGTCWLVTVRTADGSSLSAVFKLR
jgi:HYR domain